ETLFIAGGGYSQVDRATAQFGKIAFPARSVTALGSVSMGWPELTGTGDAQLWGFFPSETGIPRIAQLDKASGSDNAHHDLNMLSGRPSDWAFAFWGDAFYVFLRRAAETSTIVYNVRRSTGALSTFDTTPGYIIVGAGVSTCAPIVGVQGDSLLGPT